MSGFETVLPALARLGADPLSGVHLNPGASDTSIRHMQDAARRELGEPIPDASTFGTLEELLFAVLREQQAL